MILRATRSVGRQLATHRCSAPPGHAYVYVVYGMHLCLNIVAGREGREQRCSCGPWSRSRASNGCARIAPGSAIEISAEARARLAAALAVDRTLDGIDLSTSDTLWIEAGPSLEPEAIVSGPRIGVRAGVEHPWRFVEAGSRWISRPAVTPRVRAGARRA